MVSMVEVLNFQFYFYELYLDWLYFFLSKYYLKICNFSTVNDFSNRKLLTFIAIIYVWIFIRFKITNLNKKLRVSNYLIL